MGMELARIRRRCADRAASVIGPPPLIQAVRQIGSYPGPWRQCSRDGRHWPMLSKKVFCQVNYIFQRRRRVLRAPLWGTTSDHKKATTEVHVLLRLAAAQRAESRLSRDFGNCSIFDFFDNIDPKQPSAARNCCGVDCVSSCYRRSQIPFAFDQTQAFFCLIWVKARGGRWPTISSKEGTGRNRSLRGDGAATRRHRPITGNPGSRGPCGPGSR